MKIIQRISDDQALDLVKNGGRLEWFDNGTTSHRVNSETGEHEISTTVKKAFQIFKDGYYYHVNKTTAKKICHENGLGLKTVPESLKWSSVASVVKPENVFNVVARKNGRVSVMTGSPEPFRACQVILSKQSDATRPYCSIEPIAPVVAFYDLPKSFQDRAYRDRQGSGEDYAKKRYFVIGGDLYCLDDIEAEHGA